MMGTFGILFRFFAIVTKNMSFVLNDRSFDSKKIVGSVKTFFSKSFVKFVLLEKKTIVFHISEGSKFFVHHLFLRSFTKLMRIPNPV